MDVLRDLTIKKCRAAGLALLGLLAIVMLAACDSGAETAESPSGVSSPAAAPSTRAVEAESATATPVPTATPAPVPTSTPTPIPTPTPTPRPTDRPMPTLPPAEAHINTPGPEVDYYDFDPKATFGDLFDTLSESEQACISEQYSDEELAELRELPLTGGQDEEGGSQLTIATAECLEPEKASGLFYSFFVLGIEEEAGELSAGERACLRELVENSDVILILKAGSNTDEASPEASLAALAFALGLVACVPELAESGANSAAEPETVPEPELLWAVLNESRSLANRVADGVLYGGGSLGVHALNAATGEEIWHFRTEDSVVLPPVVVDGIVYVADFNYRLYALDAATGEEVWSYDTGDVVFAAPTLAGGVAYVVDEDNRLYALNAATGEPVWMFKAPHPDDPNLDDPFSTFYPTAPTVAGSRVYVAGESAGRASTPAPTPAPGVVGHARDEHPQAEALKDPVYTLIALDAATGETAWTFAIDSYPDSSPVALDGMVYLTVSNTAYALNGETGELVWSYSAEERSDREPSEHHSQTLIVDGICYLAPNDNLYALDVATGEVLWTYESSRNIASPVIAEGALFGWSGIEFIFALDPAAGEEIWTLPTPWTDEEEWHRLLVSDGVLYAESGLFTKDLYAIDTREGMPIWKLGENILSITVSDGVAYLGNWFGMYAYGAPEGR